MMSRPRLDWDACLTSAAAGNSFRDEYYKSIEQAPPRK
jgi:hypothetical protein